MENNKCVDSCPYARPLAKDFVCTACEPGKMFSEDKNNCVAPGEPGCVRKAIIDGEQRCIADEVCPDKTWLSMNDEFLCVTECEHWVEDTNTKEHKCVSECPTGSILDDEKQCKKCADINKNTPYLDGQECVTTCPYARPMINADNVCGACPENTIWKNGECTECAEANPARPVWDDTTSTCRACGTNDEGLFWDGKQCVEKCP